MQTYLTDRQVAERLSVSKPTVWRWVNVLPDFPQPIKLGPNTTRWRLDDIEAWEARRAA